MEYVVCDGHTLGYQLPNNTIGIYRQLESRGATFELCPGWKFKSEFKQIIKATKEDFADFRVMLPPDFARFIRLRS